MTDQTTEQSTITPEKVRELLEGITPGKWMYNGGMFRLVTAENRNTVFGDIVAKISIGNDDNDGTFIAAAPAIAQAYLDKCEEVERLQAIIDKQDWHPM